MCLKIADCCFCGEPVLEGSDWNITETIDWHHVECYEKERVRRIVRNKDMREDARWLKEHMKQVNKECNS